MNRKVILVSLILGMLLLAACKPAVKPADNGVSAEPQVLTVMTHDSFSVSESVISEFEIQNNAKVSFVQSGDAGQLLNRAILSKEAPIADVLYGVDNSFLSRALDEDIFLQYDSPLLERIPEEFKLDSRNRALPVDFGDICINFDKAYFADSGLALPQSLGDLTKPEYAGLLVVENPATSSPGMGFLLATIAEFGEDGYLEFWADMRANGVVVVNDWETAYYTNFSASSGRGAQPMVVSYGSSPPAEVIYASVSLEDAPTASLTGKNMCYRQVEFAGILQGTQNQALAEKFIDFMLGKSFQEDLPLQMFVYPVNPEAALPDEFVKYAQQPAEPASLDPELIAANREKWVQAWDETVLR